MALAALKLCKLTRTIRISGVHSMCTFSKESSYKRGTNVPIPSAKRTPDVLLQQLKRTDTLEETMIIVNNHSQIFNKNHVLRVLKTLFELSKIDSKFPNNIMKHKSFEQLLFSIKKECRTMQLNEIIEILKILSYLKVPSNSAIFQILLQLVRQNINKLDLQQVMFLNFVLDKCEKTHLSDSLKLALPLVFQLQLDQQIDHENIHELVDLLQYASKNDIPDKYVNNILTCLLLQSEKLEAQHFFSIILSLCFLRHMEDQRQLEKLLPVMLEKFSNVINKMSYDKIIIFLNFLKDAILDKDIFYNPKVLDGIADFVITNDIGFDKGIQIAKLLNRVSHRNLGLLNYLSDVVLSNPKCIHPVFNLFTYVSCLSCANHKPNGWEILQKHILDSCDKSLEESHPSWLRLFSELVSLDCYNTQLLEKIFTRDTLEEYFHNPHKITYLQVFQLYTAIKAFHPQLSNIFVPASILNKGIDINCENLIDKALQKSLELALGGEQYLASNVLMPNGIFVDCVIGYRDGNYAVAISNPHEDKIIKYEDLDMSSCKQIVCVLGLHKGHFSRNGCRLRASSNLISKILEKSGYRVLVLALPQWMKMHDSEKIPFLMREINYVLTEPSHVDQIN